MVNVASSGGDVVATLSVKLSNTGQLSGTEVVQVRAPQSLSAAAVLSVSWESAAVLLSVSWENNPSA